MCLNMFLVFHLYRIHKNVMNQQTLLAVFVYTLLTKK